jgi:hypothetical protein
MILAQIDIVRLTEYIFGRWTLCLSTKRAGDKAIPHNSEETLDPNEE